MLGKVLVNRVGRSNLSTGARARGGIAETMRRAVP